jgi:hypothetical protein
MGQVYQFMAHNNAKVNVSIADRTRKDGIAMKTIAILGMIFLPGTFLAVSILLLLSLHIKTTEKLKTFPSKYSLCPS